MLPSNDARKQMVDSQLAGRGVRDSRVLEAMASVPREAFLPAQFASHAYDDGPLDIGLGQTLSQPYIVALMLEWLELEPGARVLDIGCGSGYVAALLSHMGARVIGVERHAELARRASQSLREVGSSARILAADAGALVLPQRFDAIHVAAAGEEVPRAWLDALVIGGRLVMPVGPEDGLQFLERWTRRSVDDFQREIDTPVRFVPLIDDSDQSGPQATASATR